MHPHKSAGKHALENNRIHAGKGLGFGVSLSPQAPIIISLQHFSLVPEQGLSDL